MVIYLIFLHISLLFCTIFCLLILFYQRKKLEQYVTLLDKLMNDFVKIYWVYCILGNITAYFLAFPLPFGEKWTVVWLWVEYMFLFGTFFYFNAIVIIKYLLIFHPSAIADSNYTDQEILGTVVRLLINKLIDRIRGMFRRFHAFVSRAS